MIVYEVIQNQVQGSHTHQHWFRIGALLIRHSTHTHGGAQYRAIHCNPTVWVPGGGWDGMKHDAAAICLSHIQEIRDEYLKPIELPALPLDAVERFLSDERYTLDTALQNHLNSTDSKGEPA